MAKWCDLIQVVSGSVSALIGAAAMAYMGLFYSGITEELGIKNVFDWNHSSLLHSNPLVNNSLLILFFCVCHSLFARQWFKNLLSPILSPTLYRHAYTLQTSFLIFLLGYGWTHAESTLTLWDVRSPLLRFALFGVCAFGVCLMTVSFLALSALEFFAIAEPLSRLTGNKKEKKETGLVTTGLYGLVRHPIYFSLFISLWFHPTMTLTRLMIAGGVTVYILIATPLWEEPDLINIFGDQYRKYMKTTPMLLPLLRLGSKTNKEN